MARPEGEATVERMAPPISVVLLDEISIKLDRLLEAQSAVLETLRSQIPKGISMDWEETVTLTDPWYLDFLKDTPFRPLFRIEIINKGPDTVHARVKVREESPYEIDVETDETIPVDVKRAAIEYVNLYVDRDKTATVKILGLY
jgi:hypothetical protein